MDMTIEHLPNGVTVNQATGEAADKSNIYCEYPWCPPDSSYFIYMRHAPEHDPNSMEYVSCYFETWEKRVLGRGTGGRIMANGGKFYYWRINRKNAQELVEIDLEKEADQVIDVPDGVPRNGSFDISAGGRYLAFDKPLSFDPQMFAVGVADLVRGTVEIIHEDPYICNTHLQFEPATGRQLMVQHNRGCDFTPDGTRTLLCGPEGCTLFLLSVPDGAVTRLPVGPPHTASLSGHETWLGPTGELIATLNYTEDYDYGKGRIIGVKPGERAREVCTPWELNHIGVEPSGRVFAGDAYMPDEIIIGSTRTNRAAVVCQSKSTYNRWNRREGAENYVFDTHPHAYISPDRKWVVFSSDRTGTAQVYAAAIPKEMIEEIGEEQW
jgi:hypothetical protein